jgi:hypothetical protein
VSDADGAGNAEDKRSKMKYSPISESPPIAQTQLVLRATCCLFQVSAPGKGVLKSLLSFPATFSR